MKTKSTAKYDIFISCKSDDYTYAEEIYKFLTGHGKTVFLASEELKRLGATEYKKKIEEALEHSTHLIVFASNAEYFEAEWVRYEWDLFTHGLLSGTKSGNVIPILKNVEHEEMPYALKKYQSLTFEKGRNYYREQLLSYVGNDSETSPVPKPKQSWWSSMPEWLQAILAGLAVFIGVYILFFSIGYGSRMYSANHNYAPEIDLLSHVEVSGPIITYNNLGICAVYDAELRTVRDININKLEYELTGTDFLRSAAIVGGFAIWVNTMKVAKLKGKAGVAFAVGTFIGTLFGYSTGRYIADQNILARHQKDMATYLKDDKHWIMCQQKYDERKALNLNE